MPIGFKPESYGLRPHDDDRPLRSVERGGPPTLVAALVPRDAHTFFQSANGIVGMRAILEEADDLTNAGGSPISTLPGAATFRQRDVAAAALIAAAR